jgi:putative transposase
VPDYRRVYLPGRTYFFTVVTEGRRRFLTDPEPRTWLRRAFQEVRRQQPFRLVALCLLPDHLHCLWTLPQGDSDFSRRWQQIKAGFSKQALRGGRFLRRAESSKARRREAGIWQRRFWEHCVRDEQDLHSHLDYIHFNPVKHRLVQSPADWPWSSFHRYVRAGWYEQGWGVMNPPEFEDKKFGE